MASLRVRRKATPDTLTPNDIRLCISTPSLVILGARVRAERNGGLIENIGGVPDPGQVVAKPPHLQAIESIKLSFASKRPRMRIVNSILVPTKDAPQAAKPS